MLKFGLYAQIEKQYQGLQPIIAGEAPLYLALATSLSSKNYFDNLTYSSGHGLTLGSKDYTVLTIDRSLQVLLLYEYLVHVSVRGANECVSRKT